MIGTAHLLVLIQDNLPFTGKENPQEYLAVTKLIKVWILF